MNGHLEANYAGGLSIYVVTAMDAKKNPAMARENSNQFLP
jgi:hypothetical protein